MIVTGIALWIIGFGLAFYGGFLEGLDNRPRWPIFIVALVINLVGSWFLVRGIWG